MNITLWIVQALLLVAFIGSGAMKLFAYPKYKTMVERKGQTTITPGLATFVGIVEIAGAIGIVLPMAADVAPSLSAWAAVGLATVMLLAVVFHVRHRESPTAPAVLFALSLFVALGRLAHWA